MADAFVRVDLDPFLTCERTLPRSFRELGHSLSILSREVKGENDLGGALRKAGLFRRNDSSEDLGFVVRSSDAHISQIMSR